MAIQHAAPLWTSSQLSSGEFLPLLCSPGRTINANTSSLTVETNGVPLGLLAENLEITLLLHTGEHLTQVQSNQTHFLRIQYNRQSLST